jgi:hypothetical protein
MSLSVFASTVLLVGLTSCSVTVESGLIGGEEYAEHSDLSAGEQLVTLV